MALILPFVRKTGSVFDDRVTQMMGDAYDRACKELHDRRQPEIIHDVMAKLIVEAARRGERDPVRLRDAGLVALRCNNDKRLG